MIPLRADGPGQGEGLLKMTAVPSAAVNVILQGLTCWATTGCVVAVCSCAVLSGRT